MTTISELEAFGIKRGWITPTQSKYLVPKTTRRRGLIVKYVRWLAARRKTITFKCICPPLAKDNAHAILRRMAETGTGIIRIKEGKRGNGVNYPAIYSKQPTKMNSEREL